MSSNGMVTRSRTKRNGDKAVEAKENDKSDGKKSVKKNVSKGMKNAEVKESDVNGDTDVSVPTTKSTRGRKKKVEVKEENTDTNTNVENDDSKNGSVNGNDGSSSTNNETKNDTKPAPKPSRGRKKKVENEDDSDVEKKKVKANNEDKKSPTSDTNEPDSKDDQPSKASSSKGRKKKIDTQEGPASKQKKTKIVEVKKDVQEKKKVVMPVDPFALNRQIGWSVFVDKELGPYSITLNQTDVSNNNNKFIILQVLKKDDSEDYSFFQRWGRVGFAGQHKRDDGNQSSMVFTFCSKFRDKTGHAYKGHIEYEKKPKKYFPIEMAGEEVNSEDEAKPVNIPESKLEESVRKVLELICDTKTIAKTLKDMNFDVDKMPLGKLTKKQITVGYECLKAIETAITAKNKAGIVEAVDMYYTNIPHFFGMRKPKLIETMEDLKKEIELLDTLWEIEATMKTINEEKPKKEMDKHPMDEFYDKMKCGLKVLPPRNKMRKTIEDVIKNTQGPTHEWCTCNVKNVFEVKRETEDEKFLKDIPNRKLLWHGSRVTNWYGILSQGLRIAPKEAPVTGYMFDKGIYLADLSSKSINYCFASPGQTGFLALVEAAIGNPNVKLTSDYKASKTLKKDEHSVKGEGRMIPSNEIKLENGSILYNGPIVDNTSHNSEDYSLYYNEYIVYNTDQVRLRYLVELEFCQP